MDKILVISPHMDDEVLGVGGTIMRHKALGDSVTVCFVCNRAYNHQYCHELIEKEKENALSAKRILGYDNHFFCDMPDERAGESLIQVIIALEEVVKKIEPTCVYIPCCYDNNQDHRAVFDAAMVAVRSFANPSLNALYMYEVPSSTDQAAQLSGAVFVPNHFVDITPYHSHKMKALLCYEKEARAYPHPRSPKAVEAWAMKRGVEVSLHYAEAFSLIRNIERSV
jgi:LmbE family N-acetylglucosaminyl deacetylase